MYYYLLLTSGRGRLLGPALGLEKTLHTENKKEKRKFEDGQNGNKIGCQ